MSTISPPISALLPAALSALDGLRHQRYSVQQYEELVRQGRISENDRCELIRGVIIDKMGIGNLHLACVNRLTSILATIAANRFQVSIQNPVQFTDSEPEPDCSLLKVRDDYYSTRKPKASDVLLLIEVADSSLEFDRVVKRPLYAENGIQEYWIVNLIDDCIEVYRQPQPGGIYTEPRIAKRGESIAILTLPELVLQVDDILGREPPSP